jgi:hypothetical protein
MIRASGNRSLIGQGRTSPVAVRGQRHTDTRRLTNAAGEPVKAASARG